MPNIDFNLQIKDIATKEFKTSIKGYSKSEVDYFLNLIIEDYEQFYKIIKKLDVENKRLEDIEDQFEKTQSFSKDNLNDIKDLNQTNNFDMIQRVSRLEDELHNLTTILQKHDFENHSEIE